MKKITTTIIFIAVLILSSFVAPKNKTAKYIFFFIGDGMGIAQVTSAEAYLSDKNGKVGSENLSFSNFPYTGFATTFSANKFTTCSSAAGTALSTGYKTFNNMLGILPDSTTNLKSITYKLKNKGFAIGVSSNVGINHATPAAFYANSISRTDYYNIGKQLSKTGFDLFAGAWFIQATGKKKDQQSLLEITKQNGYEVVPGSELKNVGKNSGKVYAYYSDIDATSQNLPYAINRKDGEAKLSDMVEDAIKFLKERSKNGFFLMCEGGMIDWGAHDNDAATTIKEVIDLSDAVKIAVNFYKKYPDETLIVVTADHETGGMTMSVSGGGKEGFAAIDGQKSSLGLLGKQSARKICDSINKAAGFGFTSVGHTGIVVPVYAIGVGAEMFTGKMDNTDIPKKIMKAAGFDF